MIKGPYFIVSSSLWGNQKKVPEDCKVRGIQPYSSSLLFSSQGCDGTRISVTSAIVINCSALSNFFSKYCSPFCLLMTTSPLAWLYLFLELKDLFGIIFLQPQAHFFWPSQTQLSPQSWCTQKQIYHMQGTSSLFGKPQDTPVDITQKSALPWAGLWKAPKWMVRTAPGSLKRPPQTVLGYVLLLSHFHLYI